MRLAITLGDPAGVGPEVSAAAVRAGLTEREELQLVLVGPRGLADRLAPGEPRVSAVCQNEFVGPRGVASAAGGRAALAALHAAIALANAGEVDGLVTAPLSKEALALAGSADRGHTGILARHLASGPVAMAFLGERLRVVLATEHLPLRQALAALTVERLVEVTGLFDAVLRRWPGLTRPRLALAGLNPHAGEAGLLGDEEQALLVPAQQAAVRAGYALSGPWPADALFRRALDGEFDGVVALYHDQGLIPVKLLGLGAAVNVTLGLRLPRTSPDHGTAFDRVGTDRVRSEGMIAALRLAMALVER